MPRLVINANDTVHKGTNGDDFLAAVDGEDSLLLGKGGNDTLVSGTGNDRMNGGPGEDTYVFGANNGKDEITSFDPAEDMIDLSGAGISDLEGLISDDPDGNAVIDLGDGNCIVVKGVSTAELEANADNIFELADPPPPAVEDVFLGINDTYTSTDYADFTDQRIFADNNDEGDTDTDIFDFDIGTGNDTIVDFQIEDFDFGGAGFIPGDTLDLTGYGIFGKDNTGIGAKSRLQIWRDDPDHTRLVDIVFELADNTTVSLDDFDPLTDTVVNTILLLDDDGNAADWESSITLLGITEEDMNVMITANITPF